MLTQDHKFFAEHDHYDILKIDASATAVEVEQAFRDLTQNINLQHPDEAERITSAEKLLLSTQAYEILSDPIARSRYDLKTFGRRSLPSNFKIDTLFREAIKAYRTRKDDLALRYFKELVQLFPHRSLYRVHLAITYAEKGWTAFCEAELKTALRLDPKDQFAQETVGKLLFKVPDRTVVLFGSVLQKQVATLAAGFFLLTSLWVSGIPQKTAMAALNKVNQGKEELLKNKPAQATAADTEAAASELPEEVQAEMKKKQASPVQDIALTKLEPDYVPADTYYDYTKLVAEQKTYYPEQKIVVVTYEDGSILTYKPHELKGWKEDAKTKQTVVLTRNNELIPAPATLPLRLPDGQPANLQAEGFPTNLFPEYAAPAADTAAAPPGDTPAETAKASSLPPPTGEKAAVL